MFKIFKTNKLKNKYNVILNNLNSLNSLNSNKVVVGFNSNDITFNCFLIKKGVGIFFSKSKEDFLIVKKIEFKDVINNTELLDYESIIDICFNTGQIINPENIVEILHDWLVRNRYEFKFKWIDIYTILKESILLANNFDKNLMVDSKSIGEQNWID